MDVKFAKTLVDTRNHMKVMHDTIFFGVRGKKSTEDRQTAIDCAKAYAAEMNHAVLARVTLGEPKKDENGNIIPCHDHWYGSYPSADALEEAYKKASVKMFFEILPAMHARSHYLDIEWNPDTINKITTGPEWSPEDIVKNMIKKVNDFAEKFRPKHLDRLSHNVQACQSAGISASKNWQFDKPSFHIKFDWGFKNQYEAREFADQFNEYILKNNDPYTTWIKMTTPKKTSANRVAVPKTESIVDNNPYSKNQAWRSLYNHKLEDKYEKKRILSPVWNSSTNFQDHLVGSYEGSEPLQLLEIDLQSASVQKERIRYRRKDVNKISQKNIEEVSNPIPEALLRKVVNALSTSRVEDYHAWIRTGFAIFNTSIVSNILNVGREIFHQISQKSAKYDKVYVDNFWNSIRYRSDGLGWANIRYWIWSDDRTFYKTLSRGEYRNHMLWLDMDEVRAQYMPNFEKHAKNGMKILQYAEKTVRPFDLKNNDVIFIRSGMGSGKSRKSIDLIVHGSYHRVLLILPRRSLIQDFLGKVNSRLAEVGKQNFFKSYLDPDQSIFKDSEPDEKYDDEFELDESVESDKFIDLNGFPRLGILPESLHRIDAASYDLIIMDESEACFSSFSSSTMKKLQKCKSSFERLFKNAPKIILMDANQTDKTYNSVIRLCTGKKLQCHVNFGTNSKDRLAIPIIGKTGGKKGQLMARAILAKLRKNERVAVYSTSQKWAIKMMNQIEKKLPYKKGFLYDSQTDSKIKAEHFKNVDKYWSQTDVIIYTPTVSVGVSFEVADYFDCLFVYAYNQSCPIQDIFQGTARVRKLKSNSMYFTLVDDFVTSPTRSITYEKTKLDVLTHGSLTAKYLQDDPDHMYSRCQLKDSLEDLCEKIDKCSLADLDNLTLITEAIRLKKAISLQATDDWMFDVHLRNEWGLNITRSGLTFGKVFEDFCDLSGWTIDGSLTEADIDIMDGLTDKNQKNVLDLVELPVEEQYENIPQISAVENEKLERLIRRGKGSRMDQRKVDRFWFDSEFVRNPNADEMAKANVFDQCSLSKNKDRIKYNIFCERFRDPNEMANRKLDNNPYLEAFPSLPLILKGISQLCSILNIKHSLDDQTSFPDALIEQNSGRIHAIVKDLTFLMKIRESRSGKPTDITSLRRSIHTILFYFSGAQLKTTRKRVTDGPLDGKKTRMSVSSSRIHIDEDSFISDIREIIE